MRLAIVNRIIRYIREAKLKPGVNCLLQYYAKSFTRKIYQAMLSDNIKPNVVTYTVLIDAKSGHLETGLKVFRSMHCVGIFPNEFTYCTIMDAYCNKSQINEALDFFDEMQRKGIKPDTAVVNYLTDGYNRLIPCCFCTKRWRVFDPLRGKSWRAMTREIPIPLLYYRCIIIIVVITF